MWAETDARGQRARGQRKGKTCDAREPSTKLLETLCLADEKDKTLKKIIIKNKERLAERT